VANYLFGIYAGRRSSSSVTSDVMKYSIAFELWKAPIVFPAVTAHSALPGQVVAIGRGSNPGAVGCNSDGVGTGGWADAERAFSVHKQQIKGPTRRSRGGGLPLDTADCWRGSAISGFRRRSRLNDSSSMF